VAKIWATLCDSRGNPSRWAALALALVFGVSAVVMAATGGERRVTVTLCLVFLVCFNVAFGRPTVNEVVIELAKRYSTSGGKR
jgi:hypothetical protein